MKSVFTKTAVMAGLLFISAPALAQDTSDGPYISGSVGWVNTPDADFNDPTVPATGEIEYDSDVTFALALGTHLTPNFRAEIEAGYRKPEIERFGGVAASGDLETWTGLVNAYYDFLPQQSLSPYVSAGLGFAHHDASIRVLGTNDGGTDTVFAWQAGAGATFDVTERVGLQAGYRYLASADAEFTTTEVEYDAHEFLATLIYGF